MAPARSGSGHTPVVVEQDFATTTFLINMAAIVEEDAQAETNERLGQSLRAYKDPQCRINRTIKNRLIGSILEPDGDQRDRASMRRSSDSASFHPRSARP